MALIHWIRFVLVFWGLVYITTQSAILQSLRIAILRRSLFLGVLVFCPACSGFWIGLGFGLLGLYGPALAPNSIAWLESALACTALGYLWSTYFGDSEVFARAQLAVSENADTGV